MYEATKSEWNEIDSNRSDSRWIDIGRESPWGASGMNDTLLKTVVYNEVIKFAQQENYSKRKIIETVPDPRQEYKQPEAQRQTTWKIF